MTEEIKKFDALFEELYKVSNAKSAEILVHLLHESAYLVIKKCPELVHIYSNKLSIAEKVLQEFSIDE